MNALYGVERHAATLCALQVLCPCRGGCGGHALQLTLSRYWQLKMAPFSETISLTQEAVISCAVFHTNRPYVCMLLKVYTISLVMSQHSIPDSAPFTVAPCQTDHFFQIFVASQTLTYRQAARKHAKLLRHTKFHHGLIRALVAQKYFHVSSNRCLHSQYFAHFSKSSIISTVFLP